ncbi:hypothetical protein ABR737_34515 [Streptomyces sp. Edi2]|uniref:hypothetical protein n=1 Tax=Streptomyces sp. Edi2 TaxID=3162528 RepID=UPI003306268D
MSTKGPFSPLAAVNEDQAALRGELRNDFTRLNPRFDTVEAKVDRNQAQIVELLTALLGKTPNGN